MKKVKFRRKHENVISMYENDFEKDNPKKKKNLIDIINNAMNKTIVSIKMLGIILFIIIIISIFLWYKSIGERLNPNVKDTLESMYNQSFIIEDKQTDKKGNGKYIAYPKGYEDYKFEIIKDGRKIEENYIAVVTREFWKKQPQEKTENFNLEYKEDSVGIIIENYDELESCLTDYYILYKESEKNIPDKVVINTYIVIEDYIEYLMILDEDTVDDFVYKIKYNYINYIIEQEKDINGISQDEVEKIWKPKKLTLIVNGTTIKEEESEAHYLEDKKEYMVYLKQITKYIDGLEFIGTTWFGFGKPKYKYNGKNITLDYAVTETKLKEYFNAQIDISIENKTMKIEIH